jgi:WD40 repeat protein
MAQDLTTSVIRILNQAGKTVGTGFLVADRLAVTCAHVVGAALGLKDEAINEAPGQDVKFCARGNEVERKARVSVKGWSPTSKGDVAFLSISDGLGDLQTVRLAQAARSGGHPYEAFGFPKQNSEAVEAWDRNTIGGLVQTWSGFTRLQLVGNQMGPGFSGGPILDCDLDRVVGMVTWGERGQHEVKALAVMAETLGMLWPELEIEEAQPTINMKVPFMVEPLPENFVERPEEFEKIVRAVLEKKGTVGITAALRGAGGYGKTTLARAVCWDLRVREAFPDGVLWVTLGENPSEEEISVKIGDLFKAIGEEWKGYAKVFPAATEHRGVLKNRRVLLIVDDVWKAQHLKYFLQPGGACTVLATTRNGDTLPGETRKVNVDAMRQAEAVRLLCAGLQEGEGRVAQELASRLGEWALLLNLVNGVLRSRVQAGLGLKEALINAGKLYERRGVIGFDSRDAGQREEAVAKTLQASIELMRTDDRARYFDLAVFAEDVDVPLAAVETLWGMDEIEAEDLCQYLVDHSLLLRFNLKARTLRLHDVIRDYLIRQQNEQELHHKLVEAYRGKCKDGWHTGPKDGYFWQRLTYHLSKALMVEELRKVLLNYQWMEAHLFVGGISEIINDYSIGLEILKEDQDTLRLIQGALRLSGNVLVKDYNQLAEQLWGRLSGLNENKIISFLDQITKLRALDKRGWLRPIHICMDPPGAFLVCTLEGHSESVTDLAISSDGKYVISASIDGSLILWDISSGRERYTLGGYENIIWDVAINPVAISPDGKYAISVSVDNTLKVWNLSNGREHRALKGHDGSINDLAISSNSQSVISASEDGTLIVWNIENGKRRYTLRGHDNAITAVKISPNGKLAVSASADRNLVVWNLQNGKKCLTLKGHSEVINSIAISPDGMFVVSASDDNTLIVWNLHSGQQHCVFTGHQSSVYSVAISQNALFVVSGSYDGTTKIWGIDKANELRTFKSHDGPVVSVAISSDNHLIVSASIGKIFNLIMWNFDKVLNQDEDPDVDLDVDPDVYLDVDPDKLVDFHMDEDSDNFVNFDSPLLRITSGQTFLQGHTDNVNKVAFTPDNQLIISASDDCTLKIWDPNSKQQQEMFIERHTGSVKALVISPNGQFAISAYEDSSLSFWNPKTSEEVTKLFVHTRAINAVAISPDSRLAISALEGNTLIVWEINSGKEIFHLMGHNRAVLAVAISSDNLRAVSASEDMTLKVWDLCNGKKLHNLSGHTDKVLAMAISPDGKLIVSASKDKNLFIWEIENGQRRHSLRGHTKEVNAVAISYNNQIVVSASSDNSLIVWDLDSGERKQTLRGHTKAVNFVGISPNNQLAVSASEDNNLIVWDLLSGQQRFILSAHTDDICSVSISSDGRFAVSASKDSTIKIWNLLNGAMICNFIYNHPISCCSLDPSNQFIMAGDSDGGVFFLALEGFEN